MCLIKMKTKEFRDKVLVYGSNAFLSELQDNPELIIGIFDKAIKTNEKEVVEKVKPIITIIDREERRQMFEKFLSSLKRNK